MASKPKQTKPHPGGRQTKRTPETRKTLLDAIELGLSDKAACELAAVCNDFLYSWIKEDDEFSEDVQRARGVFKQTLHRRIANAAQDDWKAASWLLSRRCSDEYAERSILDAMAAPCPLDKLFDPVPVEGTDDTPQS
jgi:hypothetical protein